MSKSQKQKISKILIIEDDKNLSFIISKFLEKHNYQIFKAYNGSQGLDKLQKIAFDLILIDIGLPELNGFNLIKKLRNKKIQTPIIVITNNIEDYNQIKSFATGANLFHKKTINFELLIVQINQLIKNSHIYKKKLNSLEKIKIKDLEIIPQKMQIKRQNRHINLTKNEFNLLLLFIESNGKIISRNIITEKVLHNKIVESGAIDTLISRLRKKITKNNEPQIIDTIYKIGYKLNKNYQKNNK